LARRERGGVGSAEWGVDRLFPRQPVDGAPQHTLLAGGMLRSRGWLQRSVIYL
jgi:hypothetical protein